MKKRALLFVHKSRLDQDSLPCALLSCGGLSLLERQLRQVAELGVDEAFICALDFSANIEPIVSAMRHIPATTVILHTIADLKTFAESDGDVLVIDDAFLIDDRIIMAACKKNAVAAITVLKERPIGFEALVVPGGQTFAGVACVPARMIAAKAANASMASFLPGLISTVSEEPGAEQIVVEDIPLYIADQCRDVPVLIQDIRNAFRAKQGTDSLIAAVQKGSLDWPAKFIHPFFETQLIKALLKIPATPDQVALVTAISGLGVTCLFVVGHMVLALVIALILGVLNGVSGRLARTKVLTSRFEGWERVIGKLVEYSWYFAIAFVLERGGLDATVYALALLVTLFSLLEFVLNVFYRRLTGTQLEDAGGFEQVFYLIGGRRNTFLWSLLPFAILGVWLQGLWFLAIYSVITAFITLICFIIRVRGYTSGLSPIIARNFRNTPFF